MKAKLLTVRSQIHRRVFLATRGRLLGRWGGLPVVMLTTIRRSGEPLTTMLAVVAKDDGHLVVAASNGGASRDPVWFRNLRDRPNVKVLMRGRHEDRRARLATSEEKARLWPEISSRSPSYARYQEQTSRDIPLVYLGPAPTD